MDLKWFGIMDKTDNVPATKQERLNIFFDKCTIALSDQPSYTKRDIHRFITEKNNDNIRHFCQDLVSDAKQYVEQQHTFTGDDMTEEDYIIDEIRRIANE